MINKFYATLCLLFLLPGCWPSTSLPEKQTFIIQAPFDFTIIQKIQDEAGPSIASIIKEETGLEENKNMPFFFFKKRAAITVYYVNEMYEDGQSILFPALEDVQKLPIPQNVSISSNVDLFGLEKEDPKALTDLVIVIDDPKAGLSHLNEEVKQLVHHANEKYKKKYDRELYDIAKSERHSYNPHLSIGHLRANHIKQVINDPSKTDDIINRIKQRILDLISNMLSEIPQENRKISFNTLNVYDLQKRTYIKEYPLQ